MREIQKGVRLELENMEKEEKAKAVQLGNSHMESESTKKTATKIEIVINPTISKEHSENKEVVIHPNQTSILIAEDDEFYLGYIETILFSFDYNILHAKNGQEAVNIYRSNNDIKLILMDIQMPVMDGFSATKEIRKLNPEIPIIAQSSICINGIKKKAIRTGCNDFLQKPVTPETLTMKIQHYLKLTN